MSDTTVSLAVSAIIDSMTVRGRIVTSDGAVLGTFNREVEVDFESAVRKQVEADILAERGKQSQHWRIYNACARIARDGADG